MSHNVTQRYVAYDENGNRINSSSDRNIMRGFANREAQQTKQSITVVDTHDTNCRSVTYGPNGGLKSVD